MDYVKLSFTQFAATMMELKEEVTDEILMKCFISMGYWIQEEIPGLLKQAAKGSNNEKNLKKMHLTKKLINDCINNTAVLTKNTEQSVLMKEIDKIIDPLLPQKKAPALNDQKNKAGFNKKTTLDETLGEFE